MNELSDNELIKRIRNGDTESLDLLIRRYSPQVKIMVRKLFLWAEKRTTSSKKALWE